MADAVNVPVTVQSTFTGWGMSVVIGEQTYMPNPADLENAFWFLVVDLGHLQVVANEITTANDQVPTDVQQYATSPKFLLILVTQGLRTDNVPQGPLYTFLKQTGAGPKLDMAEQINTQLGTGAIGNLSYILVATMDTASGGGFEAFSYTDLSVMTFQLMPIVVGGNTIYAPIDASS